jgi:hypothetical protein
MGVGMHVPWACGAAGWGRARRPHAPPLEGVCCVEAVKRAAAHSRPLTHLAQCDHGVVHFIQLVQVCHARQAVQEVLRLCASA